MCRLEKKLEVGPTKYVLVAPHLEDCCSPAQICGICLWNPKLGLVLRVLRPTHLR